MINKNRFYVKDGKIYPLEDMQPSEYIIDSDDDLEMLTGNVFPGSIARIAGTKTMYEMTPAGEWAEFEEGGSGSDFAPDITNPQDGQVLIYDGTAGKWVNGAGGGGTLNVTESYDEQTGITTLDKTWEEIHSAIVNGLFVPIVRHEEQGGIFVDYVVNQILLSGYTGEYIVSDNIEGTTPWSTNNPSGYPSRQNPS